MPPLTENARTLFLQKRVIDEQKTLIPILLRARERITDRMVRAVRRKDYSTSKRIRNGVERDIGRLYHDLNGDLDSWAERGISRHSKEWFAIAKDDLRLTDGDRAAISFTRFSREHLADYSARINPFNAKKLVATQRMNPELVRMALSDIRALDSAVLEVFTETLAAGETADVRYRLLRDRVMDYADDPKTWAFIDKSGRRWREGNYFDMVNRTISANVARNSYSDTLRSEGRDTVKVIGGLSSNSRDACVHGVGKIYSMDGVTPGLPTLSEYRAAGGFGPNCPHFYVYVSPEVDPQEIEKGREEAADVRKDFADTIKEQEDRKKKKRAA